MACMYASGSLSVWRETPSCPRAQSRSAMSRVSPQVWVVQNAPLWAPSMTFGVYAPNTSSKYSGGVNSEEASSMIMMQSALSDRTRENSVRCGVTAFSHEYIFSGSIIRAIMVFSMPSRLLTQAMGPLTAATRKRSSFFASLSAASFTMLGLLLVTNSSGVRRSSGTSSTSPSGQYLKVSTEGWASLLPG